MPEQISEINRINNQIYKLYDTADSYKKPYKNHYKLLNNKKKYTYDIDIKGNKKYYVHDYDDIIDENDDPLAAELMEIHNDNKARFHQLEQDRANFELEQTKARLQLEAEKAELETKRAELEALRVELDKRQKAIELAEFNKSELAELMG